MQTFKSLFFFFVNSREIPSILSIYIYLSAQADSIFDPISETLKAFVDFSRQSSEPNLTRYTSIKVLTVKSAKTKPWLVQ